MSSAGVGGKPKASWRAKLLKTTLPRLVPVPEGMTKRLGTGMMLIPTALEIDAMIRKIPHGQVSSISQIRRRLARWHAVDVTCPLVTGIFLRIVAEAAEEDRLAGMREVTPYWRVVREKGELNAKFPGGVEEQARRLAEEGHTIAGDRVVQTQRNKSTLKVTA
jgi:alkylated DNA nucleotide flippase Atl1